MKLQAGEQLGPYQVLALIGTGGMGEVYRARDSRIGRDVALKVLPCSATSDLMRRFEQEARAAGMLNHPNVLTVYDVGSHDGSPFIVSELLEGISLREQMALHLPQRKAIEYAQQIARGLAAAHDKGIVHRDLKPENIFILDDGRVKLLDFGLVKLIRPDVTQDDETQQLVTDAGTVLGTAGYMSPEQVRGETADHRSDIFSLGVVLFEMLTGVQPFRRASAVETMNAILHDEPITPGDIPAGISRITLRMLEKNPGDRFQSVKDLAFALESFDGSDASMTPPSRKRMPRMPMKATPVHYERMTYRRGFVMTARFMHDGSIVYGAAWEDRPVEIFTSSSLSPESRPIGAGHADVLAVSPTGELAISLGRSYLGGFVTGGTIARLPIGGAPRVICQNGQEADWSRDGKNLLILRPVGGMYRIEMPIGTVIYESPLWISHARLSPNNELIAFIEHQVWGDDGGRAVIVDRQGNVRVHSDEMWTTTGGLAWHPKGDEVWIAAAKRGADRDIYAMTITGKIRRVFAFPNRASLHDIDAKFGVIISSDSGRREAVAARRGEQERNLSWFDWSWLAGLTLDGREVLIEEQGAAAHGTNAIYLRPIDGSPAVKIAEGRARGMPLSPDGQWILSLNNDDRLELLPVGAGETRIVPGPDLDSLMWWQFFPDGRRVLLLGNRGKEPTRMYELELDGDGTAREVSPVPVNWPMVLSNDGCTVAAPGVDGLLRLFTICGDAEPRVVPTCTAEDVPIQWAAGDRALFVYRRGRINVPVDRIDLTTGERVNWLTVHPLDPAGVLDIMPMRITPDGETYAYGYRRFLSDLYVVTGLM